MACSGERMFKLIQLSMAWLLLLYRDIILLLLWTDGGSVVVAEGDCGGWMVRPPRFSAYQLSTWPKDYMAQMKKKRLKVCVAVGRVRTILEPKGGTFVRIYYKLVNIRIRANERTFQRSKSEGTSQTRFFLLNHSSDRVHCMCILYWGYKLHCTCSCLLSIRRDLEMGESSA